MAFNYAKFKADWRAICKERKVDPVHGASVFQVIDWKAEQVKKARVQRDPGETWASPVAMDMWDEWLNVSIQLFDTEASETEFAAISSIRQQAAQMNAPAPTPDDEDDEDLEITLVKIWCEVKKELGIKDRRRLPEIKLVDIRAAFAAPVVPSESLWTLEDDEDEAWSVTKSEHIFEKT